MVWLLSSILLSTVAGFSATEVDDALQDVLGDERYQRDLPSVNGEHEPDPEPGPRRSRSTSSSSAKRPGANVSGALMWVLVAVGIGILVVWIVLQFTSYQSDGRVPEVAEEAEVVISGARAPPGVNADALARAGRFDEAVHALLLSALERLRTSRSGHLRASLTSREVLREVPLGDVPHQALRGLIEAVELSLFGGRPLDASDYERCAVQHRDFVATLAARRSSLGSARDSA